MTANPFDATDYDDCGCDVSDNNSGLNFAVLGTTGGRKFCVLKITEGLTYQDTRFSANLAALMRSNITRVGVYHFAHHESPTGQVQFFIDTFKTATQGLANKPSFLFMLDLERSANPPLESDGLAMVQALQAQGINPIIYCGFDFWSQNYPELAACPNLLAAYNNNPISPIPWRIPSANVYGWDMWQYTDGNQGPWAKTVPGGSDPMDLSCFNLAKHPQGLEAWWDDQLTKNTQP
jgi:GH25 family lysozyme M1 (1,4-beta-N-acetylmuramidase)